MEGYRKRGPGASTRESALARAGLAVVLSLLLLAAAGCGGYTELDSREPIRTVHVEVAAERTLEPAEITLDRPGTYAFEVENVTGNDAHALEIKSEEGAQINYKEGSVRTEDLSPGASAPQFKVHLEAGTYEISCPVGSHAEEGERGTITVAEGQ